VTRRAGASGRRPLPAPLLLPALLALLLLLGALPARADTIDDANDAAAEGRWSEAADLYAQVLDEQEGERDVVLSLANAVVRASRWDLCARAEAALQALHESAREDATVRLALAELLAARARAETEDLARKALLARAEAHYAALVEAEPEREDASVGLARVMHETGRSHDAVAVLDRYLNRRPKGAARALFWKGRVLYELGQAAHAAEGGGYPLSDDVSRLFARSQGACLSSAAADPTSFDTWMYVAWSSTPLGDRETALDAYEKAYALDPESPLPLQGIASLMAHDPEAKQRALDALRRLVPERRRLQLQEAYRLLAEKRWEDLAAFVRAYVDEFGEDADAAYCLGKVEEAAGREEQAIARYWRALELDGRHVQAAEELDRRLRKDALVRARTSLEDARTVYADYARIFELAPGNPYVRNNAAFVMREAWKAHPTQPSWREILLLSAKTYEAAARAIGPWRDEKEQALSWADRYAYAQIINDTGIVFHLFDPIRDLERAERYYVRALRYVNWGYLDAWTYLKQVYEEQGRWQDLHDLALRCADGLATEAGDPIESARAAARALADELVASGKAKASP